MVNDLLLQSLAASNPPSEDAEYDARIDSLIAEIEELENRLSPEARDLIEDLRPMTVSDDRGGVQNAHSASEVWLTLYAGCWGLISFVEEV